MDDHQFDAIARSLFTAGSRRSTLRALLSMSFALFTLPAKESARAKRKRRRKKKRAVQITPPPPACTPNCAGKNCGDDGCGELCGPVCSRAHAAASCVAGVCTMGACDAGFVDCNGDPADGCEAQMGTTSHCSGCNDACAVGDVCAAATTTCSASYMFARKWDVPEGSPGVQGVPAGMARDGEEHLFVTDSSFHRILKFTSGGTLITSFGSQGSGAGQLNAPLGLAVAANGTVYVADNQNHRIQFFTETSPEVYQPAGTIGGPPSGSGDGQFNFPRGIAFDSTGNIYVADAGNHRIQKFDINGTFVTKWGTLGSGLGQLFTPLRLAVFGNAIYVVEAGNHRIQRFDLNGDNPQTWGGSGAGSGNGQFNMPRDITVDQSGNVYVSDGGNDRIQKFDGNGNFLTKWSVSGTGDGQLDDPWGMAVPASGEVFVVDRNNHRIQVFEPVSPAVVSGGVGAESKRRKTEAGRGDNANTNHRGRGKNQGRGRHRGNRRKHSPH